VRGRTLVSWSHEVEALADALDIERFGVIGWSAGGPHALAVGATLPDRVTRIGLVASMPTADGAGALPRDVQRVTRLARVLPRAAGRGLERWGRLPPFPTGDPATDDAYARGRVESFRRGGLWLARELAYLARPWGFDLAEVRQPVTLWWGESDRVCPPSIGRDYERALPNVRLELVEGTHQLLFSRWRDILADAALS
jgi:pimeloyl-ACP methyl ester carboxylesterase